ncbi:hypothetical protein [Aquipseudomonas alcaligenes]|uniref:hypothetical protein n=1 Tax=Aquipseudomonas alcaligenes TaxID=43263 RepID=UPI000A64942A|nr:hypothetical protein [Pseudomonas alcaligenes]
MIQLKRVVSIRCFEAQATVAVGRERPEFLAVAQLASDLNRPINGQDILDELLGNCPAAMGRQVLKRCVDLGLLESLKQGDYAQLSSAGLQALAEGQVLVPEEGVWRFYIVDDPLVSQHLLHAQRLETDRAQQARNDNRKELGKQAPSRSSASSTPNLLQTCLSDPAAISVANGQLLQIKALPQQGVKAPDSTLELTLEWTPQAQPQIKLTGELASIGKEVGQRIDATLSPAKAISPSYEHLWKTLAASATSIDMETLDHWHGHTGKLILPTAFAELDAVARKVFKRDVAIPALRWDHFGTFQPTELKAVPLVPEDAPNANAWAQWLQWESIQDYATPTQLNEMADAQRQLFPYHHPRLDTPDELLARALHGERDHRSTFLLTPYDLGLWS